MHPNPRPAAICASLHSCLASVPRPTHASASRTHDPYPCCLPHGISHCFAQSRRRCHGCRRDSAGTTHTGSAWRVRRAARPPWGVMGATPHCCITAGRTGERARTAVVLPAPPPPVCGRTDRRFVPVCVVSRQPSNGLQQATLWLICSRMHVPKVVRRAAGHSSRVCGPACLHKAPCSDAHLTL